MQLSIVIPTYNRCFVIDRSIASVLPVLAEGGAELIVVDDGSSDGTGCHLRATYRHWLKSGKMRLFEELNNEGVTAAKNRGASLAVGEWVVFLDSDDELVLEGSRVLRDVCSPPGGVPYPLIFFRCRNRVGSLIGQAPATDHLVGASDCLVGWRWGECLPVVRRTALHRFPFDADLRGHEGIAYARMVKELGPALVSGKVARVYDDTGADRLSTPSGMRRRSFVLGRGHARIVVEFWRELGIAFSLVSLAKASVYFGLSVVAKLDGMFRRRSLDTSARK